ncbi:MAG TPA: tetratricopeptide repeat protein [Candidatus Nanoarchaeia archaeon]|nr:tetratricopeptide repeat protein [Candidatus Nanoarchaeia archaeon]
MTNVAVKEGDIAKHNTIIHHFLDLERQAGFKVKDHHYKTLDSIISQAEREISPPKRNTKEEAVRTLKAIYSLIEKRGFAYAKGITLTSDRLKNKMLNCHGYVTLNLAIAEVLDLPLTGVLLPKHIIARWHLDDKHYFNWETVIGNEGADDLTYFLERKIHTKAIKNELFLKSLNKDQHLAIQYVSQGRAWMDQKQPIKAYQNFTAAIEQDKNYACAYANRGALLIKNEDSKGAKDLAKALRIDPHNFTALFYTGVAASREGRTEEAVKNYLVLLKIDPRNEKALTNLGCIYVDNDKFRMAVACFSKAIEINPTCAKAYHNRSIAYHALGEKEKAIDDACMVFELS